jgi:hypothetical protein
MAIIPQAFLLNWREIVAASDLDRLRLVLEAIPDEPLMRILEQERGNGRDEYPIRPVWNSILAGVVFQHSCVACLRRELRRNGELRHSAASIAAGESRAHRLGLQQFSESDKEKIRDVSRLVENCTICGPRQVPNIDGRALPSFGKPRKDKQGDAGDGTTTQDWRSRPEADKISRPRFCRGAGPAR